MMSVYYVHRECTAKWNKQSKSPKKMFIEFMYVDDIKALARNKKELKILI